MRPRGVVPAANCVLPLLAALVTACFSYPPDRVASGQIGGRVLLAPGVGLEGARVVVTQVNLYDGMGAVRKRVGEATTDEHGYFPAVATGLTNGLLLLETQGGTYTDPVNGARIVLDPSVHLRALHWLALFEDRSTTAWITPVHAFVESRFRYQVGVLRDTFKAVDAAYSEANRQFGGLDWATIRPADLTQPATSPTDAVRASFILGGLSILADDLRQASNASPQAVGLTTLLGAMEQDMSNGPLDGDDNNDPTPGVGLQVGECEPVDRNCVPPGVGAGCALGACRTLCDVYANTYRTLLADSIGKFIGPKAAPTVWNQTGLGAEDARPLIDSIAKNKDVAAFGDACIDDQHRAPPTIVWEVAPAEGELRSGFVTVRVRAIDTQGNRVPTVKFNGYDDTDGDPENDVATASINTRVATLGVDGALTIAAIATGAAGAKATAMRTVIVDNTAPSVTLDSTGLLVDQNGVWWTNTPGPTIRGMVTDMHGPITVQVSIGGKVVSTKTVDGPDWSVQLPGDALPTGGADVSIVAIDKATNQSSRVQTMRLDNAPPNVTLAKSEVFDEANSRIDFQNQPPTGPVVVHTTRGTPLDLAQAAGGSCPTIHKYAHLLFAPKADGAHAVLGSAGNLNALQVNVVMSDDGIGLKPGSAQYQVVLRAANAADVITQPWTAIAGSGPVYAISLYRDTIPQLGTANGEYHVQLQATDKFGQSAVAEACWNVVILPPPLWETTTDHGGEIASGFQNALWGTSLNPTLPGQTGDFAAKFLNPDPPFGPSTEVAVWRDRLQNYLGVPVYVKVQIPRPPGDLSATINREFQVMRSAINGGPATFRCGPSNAIDHCTLAPSRTPLYGTDFNAAMVQSGLRFRARLFLMNGNELGAAPSCSAIGGTGCVVSSDDPNQTYVFEIPARTASQPSLPEYAILTNLLPKLPAGSGTDVTLAPSDQNSRDAGPFSEFQLGTRILTGRLVATVGAGACISEEFVNDPENHVRGWFCNTVADIVEYRALARIRYMFNGNVITGYSFGAHPSLSFSPLGNGQTGTLRPAAATLATAELALP